MIIIIIIIISNKIMVVVIIVISSNNEHNNTTTNNNNNSYNHTNYSKNNSHTAREGRGAHAKQDLGGAGSEGHEREVGDGVVPDLGVVLVIID